MLRYDRQTKPGIVALYDIRPGNGTGPFSQPRSPHFLRYTRDGLKAVLSRQRQMSRQRRGKAAMSLTEARQGRGRELEGARRGRLNSRQG